MEPDQKQKIPVTLELFNKMYNIIWQLPAKDVHHLLNEIKVEVDALQTTAPTTETEEK
jgi:hypothetical protein